MAAQAALRPLIAVDGRLLPALPCMVEALWQDGRHRAAKLPLHFEVGCGIAVDASITPGNAGEVRQLRQRRQDQKSS